MCCLLSTQDKRSNALLVPIQTRWCYWRLLTCNWRHVGPWWWNIRRCTAILKMKAQVVVNWMVFRCLAQNTMDHRVLYPSPTPVCMLISGNEEIFHFVFFGSYLHTQVFFSTKNASISVNRYNCYLCLTALSPGQYCVYWVHRLTYTFAVLQFFTLQRKFLQFYYYYFVVQICSQYLKYIQCNTVQLSENIEISTKKIILKTSQINVL